MPSPFHQKYSSQTHKIFGDNTTPIMPDVPKAETNRRASDSSVTSASSPTERRRSSVTQRFGALEALKRPQEGQPPNRRQSLHDAYGKPGVIGAMWNNFTRGYTGPSQSLQPKEPRDTTTLSR